RARPAPGTAPDAPPSLEGQRARVPPDLFLSASGWPSDAFARAVPLSCSRGVEPAPAVVSDGDGLRVTFPEWRPRTPAHRVVPALSALGESPRGFRFELSTFAAGNPAPRIVV